MVFHTLSFLPLPGLVMFPALGTVIEILTIQLVWHVSYSIITDEVLLKILNLPILVVLDEAYIEFSGLESRMKWVKQHENLIVL